MTNPEKPTELRAEFEQTYTEYVIRLTAWIGMQHTRENHKRVQEFLDPLVKAALNAATSRAFEKAAGIAEKSGHQVIGGKLADPIEIANAIRNAAKP